MFVVIIFVVTLIISSCLVLPITNLLYQSSPGVDGEAMEAGEPREGNEPWTR